MRRNLFFAVLMLLGLGLTVSSCAPGVYTSASVGMGPGYYGYGPGYYGGAYGPGYYGARPVIVNPRPVIVTPGPRYYGGPRGGEGYRGGGYRGGYGGGYHGGGRRGGR